MDKLQLLKATEIAGEKSKSFQIHTSNNKHFSTSDSSWYIDMDSNLLVIDDNLLKDTIIIDISQIVFIETKLKH